MLLFILRQIEPEGYIGNKKTSRINLYRRLLYIIANTLVKQPQNLFRNCNPKACCWFIYFHFFGEIDTSWTLKNEGLSSIYNLTFTVASTIHAELI